VFSFRPAIPVQISTGVDMSWSSRPPSVSVAAADTLDRDVVSFGRQHHSRLVRLAAIVCRDVADADDVVQAGLEQAWRRRHTLRDPEKLAPWLYRIIVREAIRLDRRGTSLLSRLFPGPREIAVEPISPSSDVEASVVERESIRIAFEALPATQRTVVALHLYAGYSMPETAEIVGV
jgi:RNA polymerase sigma-70 factor (ECF subfamily)